MTSKVVRSVLAVFTAVAMAVGMAACSSGSSSAGGEDALNEYVEAERSAIPEIMEQNAEVYTDVQIEPAPPSGVVFTYTYADQLDGPVVAEALDQYASDMEEGLDKDVFPAMRQYGIKGDLNVTFTYLNADGTEIWSKTYTEK